MQRVYDTLSRLPILNSKLVEIAAVGLCATAFVLPKLLTGR
jgi:hypothetical protein